jgi:tetratricopeptide (TPR) repeat protein
MDCTKSIEYNDKYMKSYIRRVKLYEEMDKLDEALADYQKILEMDPSNTDALIAIRVRQNNMERSVNLRSIS